MLFRKLRTLFALEVSERKIVMLVMIILPVISLWLSLFGLKRMLILMRSSKSSPVIEDVKACLKKTSKAFQAALRNSPCKGKCLSQSLALWWVLYWQHINCDICIGVRLQKGELSAHAWVEYKGVPLNESADIRERFSTFESIFNASSLGLDKLY